MSGVATAVAVSAGASYLGSRQQAKAANQANELAKQQYEQSRADLNPYRAFGEQYGLNALKDYGKFQAPTMENVYASPDFNLGLKAIENSAAARGGLLSGNFLRSAQDYGGSIYDREYSRKMSEYQNELNRLMGYTNLGYGAAGGQAGLSQDYGQTGANLLLNKGNALASGYQGIGEAVSGGLGAYQSQKRWEDLLGVYGSKK